MAVNLNTKQSLILIGLGLITLLFCLWPNFHIEKYLGLKYSWQIDLLTHSLYYLCFSLFVFNWLFSKSNRSILLFYCFLFSLCVEVLQTWIPNRSVSILDVLSNTLGILSGFILSNLIIKHKQKGIRAEAC